MPRLAKGMVLPPDFALHHARQQAHARAVMRSFPSLVDTTYGLPPARPLPSPTQSSLDWRTPGLVIPGQGVVPPVRNQAQCGCCWAFSTSNGLSAALAFYWHVPVTVSAQYFLDDSAAVLTSEMDIPWSCNGGWFAFDLVSTTKKLVSSPGAPSEASDPYRGGPAREPSGVARPYAVLTWAYVSPDGDQGGLPSDAAMRAALCVRGPLPIGVNADNSWQSYRRGVLCSAPNTADGEIDHAILLIGWDDEAPWDNGLGQGAWLVENQWDETWGENGFARVAYGHYNIGTGACYAIPVVPAGVTPVPTPTPTPVPVTPTPTPSPGTIPTTLVLTPIPATPTAGVPFEVTAVVSLETGSGSPTGNVVFDVDGSASVSTTPLGDLNGLTAATLTLTLTPGVHHVAAGYKGDPTHAPSPVVVLPLNVAFAPAPAPPPVTPGLTLAQAIAAMAKGIEAGRPYSGLHVAADAEANGAKGLKNAWPPGAP